MEIFYYDFYNESKLKIKKNFFFGGGGGGGRGRGVRVSEFLSKRIRILKKNSFFFFLFFFLEGGGGGGRVGWGRRYKWIDRRTGPNQFAPSTSSKLGT